MDVALTTTSPGTYLASEQALAARGNRHEYVGGLVFALAESTGRHATIIRGLMKRLAPVARRYGYYLYGNDVKVHIADADCYYYPDLVLTKFPREKSTCVLDRPRVVVEVLTPATAAIDRREKLVNYLKLASLSDILLVDSDSSEILHFRRAGNPTGPWRGIEVPAQGGVQLNWSGARLPAEAVLNTLS